MSLVKLLRGLLCAAIAAGSLAFGAEHELLQSQDINKIMKQIFEQHVDKKEMTASILKNAFKVYIDQFDPERIYLLDQEVRPFLQLTDAQMAAIMEQYQHNKFPEFNQLNEAIAKAIVRSRQIRAGLETKQRAELFQASGAQTAQGADDWGDPDLRRPFPKDEAQLQANIKQDLIRYISNERRRYGEAQVTNHQGQTLEFYEQQARSHENQYLFLDENGKAMSEAEKQNAFAMHILKALANSLDAHTSVLDPTEAYDMRVRLEKEVLGVGIELHQTANGEYVITQVDDSGTAAASGAVKVGDRLLEVDGKSVSNQSLNEVMAMIHGKNGSSVALTLRHFDPKDQAPGGKVITVQLMRKPIFLNEDRVQISYVPFDNGIIGKILLTSFYQGDNGVNSENDVRDAIAKLKKIGNLRGLILDLRENSGGFLAQAVKVAGLFITNGVVVISKYFNGEEHFYRDMDGKVSYDGPLVILTSKATASAAEIVAQALQDYGVALIVGDEHTYGKGTIQSQTVTENQGAAFFKVTVGKYYTVSGKTPQIQGVKADIVVPSRFAHEHIGEAYLDQSLQKDKVADAFNDDLSDISPNLKPWYLRYYTPTLQHKQKIWNSALPALKKNSSSRLAANKEFQFFLKGQNNPQADGRPGSVNKEDLQMAEAVNIVKDMITFESQNRRAQQTAEQPHHAEAGVLAK